MAKDGDPTPRVMVQTTRRLTVFNSLLLRRDRSPRWVLSTFDILWVRSRFVWTSRLTDVFSQVTHDGF